MAWFTVRRYRDRLVHEVAELEIEAATEAEALAKAENEEGWTYDVVDWEHTEKGVTAKQFIPKEDPTQ